MLICPIGGMLSLAIPGYKQYGIIGAIVGGAAGLYAGMVIGKLPWIIAMKSMNKDLKNASIDELKTKLESEWIITHFLIGELIRRGESVGQFRPFVVKLLKSDLPDQRNIGWSSAKLWFPEIFLGMSGFNPLSTLEKCREFTKDL